MGRAHRAARFENFHGPRGPVRQRIGRVPPGSRALIVFVSRFARRVLCWRHLPETPAAADFIDDVLETLRLRGVGGVCGGSGGGGSPRPRPPPGPPPPPATRPPIRHRLD